MVPSSSLTDQVPVAVPSLRSHFPSSVKTREPVKVPKVTVSVRSVVVSFVSSESPELLPPVLSWASYSPVRPRFRPQSIELSVKSSVTVLSVAATYARVRAYVVSSIPATMVVLSDFMMVNVQSVYVHVPLSVKESQTKSYVQST